MTGEQALSTSIKFSESDWLIVKRVSRATRAAVNYISWYRPERKTRSFLLSLFWRCFCVSVLNFLLLRWISALLGYLPRCKRVPNFSDILRNFGCCSGEIFNMYGNCAGKFSYFLAAWPRFSTLLHMCAYDSKIYLKCTGIVSTNILENCHAIDLW